MQDTIMLVFYVVLTLIHTSSQQANLHIYLTFSDLVLDSLKQIISIIFRESLQEFL